MEILNFKYDDTFDDWKQEFKRGLNAQGVIYTDDMITNLVRSLDLTIIKYLTSLYYKPKSNWSYRRGFIKRVSKHGLDLSIKSNETLWKYLEYFTDLTDYSKCFDIELYIANVEVATKDVIIVGVGEYETKITIPQPIHKKEYVEICEELDDAKEILKHASNSQSLNKAITKLSKVVEYLIGRLD